MRWRKLGKLYEPAGDHPKLLTHAANPVAVLLDGDIYRVFFSGRDERSRSSVGGVDIDLNSRRVVRVHEKPFFTHGDEGSFFEHGVSIGCCYATRNGRYLLFMGWQNPEGEHWRGEIGRLAVSSDLELSLENSRPFIGLSSENPYSLSYPWVIQTGDGAFTMWYGSTIDWKTENGEMLHVIKQAISTDGEQWKQNSLAIPYAIGKAQAFSRPSVIGNPGEGFHMWFSFRGGPPSKYRIGYGFSADGSNWNAAYNEAGIDVSTTGWDSEMIEYPFVFDHKGSRYMLYNGNGYGKTGFGLAVLDDVGEI